MNALPVSFREAFLDLVTITAFGPHVLSDGSAGRKAAHQLMAREHVARLALGTRDPGADHPAFAAARGEKRGGVKAARFFLWWGWGRLTYPQGGAPQTPTINRAEYAVELADVAAAAADLRAAVIAEMGSTEFDAARAPISDWVDASAALGATTPEDAGYAAALSAWQTATEDLHAAFEAAS